MKMKSRLLIPACLVVTLAAGSGQTPHLSASPQPGKPQFQPPDMGAMMSQMMNTMFTEATRPERAAQLAHFQKLYYDAVLKEGFTKGGALSIVKANQIPLMGVK